MMANAIINLSLVQDETAVFTDLGTLDAHFGQLYCHYIHPEDLFTRMLDGMPITAYCGYVWVPKRFIDNGELPLCPRCSEVFLAHGWQ